MSKHETPMTRWYWEQIGGTLIEEFPVVRHGKDCSGRWIDGVILPDGERRIARVSEVSLKGQRVIAVQAKDRRLGMGLLGQALFSARLLRKFEPASIESVALCRVVDRALADLMCEFPEVKVVLCPKEICWVQPSPQ